MSMAMSCPPLIRNRSISVVVTLLLYLYLGVSNSHCFIQIQPSHHTTALRDLVAAEKTRLGSRPPSCHNKCNECHPCMAVQVPTLPSHNRVVRPSSEALDYLGSASAGNSNRYSNYKPLGWKCRCGGHLYNP